MHDQIESRERDLVLPIRSASVVKRLGVRTVGELVRFTAEEILSAKCFGETTLREIRDALAKRGLRLGMTPVQLRGRPGLGAGIVAQQTTSARPEAEHDHDGPCCGDCDTAAGKLREQADARRAAGEVIE
jgi:hypothetical protein